MSDLDQQLSGLREELARMDRDRASWLHQHNVKAGRLLAIDAAASFDPAVDRDLETCVRRLYHERTDFKFACEQWQKKAEALQAKWEQLVALIKS